MFAPDFNPFCPLDFGGDEGWKKFGNFIDSLAIYLKNNSSTTKLIDELNEKLASSTDLNILVDSLKNENYFTAAISDYFDQLFPLNLIRCEFSKDHSQAVNLMTQGDGYFQKKDYEKALQFYSKSICMAEEKHLHPNQDDIMSILFNKRSMAFFYLQHYQESFNDADEALRLNYPGSKLSCYSRMFKASEKLEDSSMLKSLLEKCMTHMQNSDDPQGIQNLINEINLKIAESIEKKSILSNNNDIGHDLNDEYSENGAILSPDFELSEKNEYIIGASNKVDLCSLEHKGRGIIAKENIFKDDILFVEKPFAAHFLNESNASHCGNCCRRLCTLVSDPSNAMEDDETYLNLSEISSFVSCYTCNKFIFCDRKCRDEAYNRFHRLECKRFMFALENHIGISYLVIRTICSAFSDVNFSSALNQIQTGLEFTAKSQSNFYSADYDCLLSLMTHSTEHDTKSKICFLLTAFFLWHCMKKFELIPLENYSDNLSYINLMIHHLQQLSTNIVTIFEQDIVGDNLSSSPCKEQQIGYGFYPTVSLLNHSCDPDVLPIYVGSKLVLKAIRDVPAGNEVNFSYGPTYLNMNYFKRQKWLFEQYFFKCQCKACVERKENYSQAFRCVTCNGPAFLDSDDSAQNENDKMYLICWQGHINHNAMSLIDDIKQGIDYHNAGDHFMKQGLEQNDDEDIVAALVSYYKADVIFTNQLYSLHTLWLKIKNDVLNCYNKMGHNDRAAIYSRQLINAYSKHLNDVDLQVSSVKERIRLIKICWLILDELFSEDNVDVNLQERKQTALKTCEEIKSCLQNCVQLGHLMSEENVLFVQKQSTLLEQFMHTKNLLN